MAGHRHAGTNSRPSSGLTIEYATFTKIIDGDLPGRFVWRDERCTSFLSMLAYLAQDGTLRPQRSANPYSADTPGTWTADSAGFRRLHRRARRRRRNLREPRECPVLDVARRGRRPAQHPAQTVARAPTCAVGVDLAALVAPKDELSAQLPRIEYALASGAARMSRQPPGGLGPVLNLRPAPYEAHLERGDRLRKVCMASAELVDALAQDAESLSNLGGADQVLGLHGLGP